MQREEKNKKTKGRFFILLCTCLRLSFFLKSPFLKIFKERFERIVFLTIFIAWTLVINSFTIGFHGITTPLADRLNRAEFNAPI